MITTDTFLIIDFPDGTFLTGFFESLDPNYSSDGPVDLGDLYNSAFLLKGVDKRRFMVHGWMAENIEETDKTLF